MKEKKKEIQREKEKSINGELNRCLCRKKMLHSHLDHFQLTSMPPSHDKSLPSNMDLNSHRFPLHLVEYLHFLKHIEEVEVLCIMVEVDRHVIMVISMTCHPFECK